MEFPNILSKNHNNNRRRISRSKTQLFKVRNSRSQIVNRPQRTESTIYRKQRKTSICNFRRNSTSIVQGKQFKILSSTNKFSRTNFNSALSFISNKDNLKQLVDIYNINNDDYLKNEHPDILLNFNKVKDCSFLKYGIQNSPMKISYAYCKTCDSNLARTICIPCINTCHKGHTIKYVLHKGYIKCACAEKMHKMFKNSNTNNNIKCLCNEWIITSGLNIYYTNKNGEAICEMCHCYCDAECKNFNNQVNLSNMNEENKINIPNCTCKNEEIHGDKKKLFEIILKLINEENNFNISLHPVQFINMIFKSKQSFNIIFEAFITFDQKLKSSEEVFLKYLYQFSNIDITFTNIYKCIVILEKMVQKITNKYICFYCEEIRNFISFNAIKKLIECIEKSNNNITEKSGLSLTKEYLYLFHKVYINYNLVLLNKYKINDLKNLSSLQRLLIFRDNKNYLKESDNIISFLINCLKNINIKGFTCIESFDCINEIYSIFRKLSTYYLINTSNMIKISIEILNSFNCLRIFRKSYIKDNRNHNDDIKNIEDYSYFTKLELKLYYMIVKMLLNFIYTYNDKISYKLIQNKENINIMSENIDFIFKKDELSRLISKITILILTMSQKYYEESNDKRSYLVKRFGMEILKYYLNKDDNYMVNLLQSINYYKINSGWEDSLTDNSYYFLEIEKQKERIIKAYYKYFNFEIKILELYKIINDSLNIVLGKLANNIYSIYEDEIEKGFSFNENTAIIKTNYFYIILKIFDIICYNNYQNSINIDKEKIQLSFKNMETTWASGPVFQKIKKIKTIKKHNSNDDPNAQCYENQIITKIIYFYFCFTYNSSENSLLIISFYFINELMILPVKYSKLIFKLFYSCINNIAKNDNTIDCETHIVNKLYNYLEILINKKTNDDSLLICIHYFLRMLQIITYNLRTSYFNILIYRVQSILLSLDNTYNLVSKFFEVKDSGNMIRIEEEAFVDNNDESIKNLLFDKSNSTIVKSISDLKFSGITNLTKSNKPFKTNIHIFKNSNSNMENIDDLGNLNNNNFNNRTNKTDTLNKCFLIYITLINDCFDFSMNEDRKNIIKVIKIDKVIFALKNYKLNLDLRTEFLRFIRKMTIDIQYSTEDNVLYSKAIIDINDNLSYIKNNRLIHNLKYPTKLLSFTKDFYNISAKSSILEKLKEYQENINSDKHIFEYNNDGNKTKKLSKLDEITEEENLKSNKILLDVFGSDIINHHLTLMKIPVDCRKSEKIKIEKLNLDPVFDSLRKLDCKPSINQKSNKKLINKNLKLENEKNKYDGKNEKQENGRCRIKFFLSGKNCRKKVKEKEYKNEDEKIGKNKEKEEKKPQKKNNEKNKEGNKKRRKQKNKKYSHCYTTKRSFSSSINDSNNSSNSSYSIDNKKSDQKQKKEKVKDGDSSNDKDAFNNTIEEKCSEAGSSKINININSIEDLDQNDCNNGKSKNPTNGNFNLTRTKKDTFKNINEKSNINNEKNIDKLNKKGSKKVGFIVDEKLTKRKKTKKNMNDDIKATKIIDSHEKSEMITLNIDEYEENSDSSIDESKVYKLDDSQLNKIRIKNNLVKVFDDQFYGVLLFELENLIINIQDIELNDPVENDKLRNYFENGLLIPIIYYFKKVFTVIQDFTGKELIKLYTLLEGCISLKLYISGFKFDFWRKRIDKSNTIYFGNQNNINGINTNKISINLQNYGKTNLKKESIIDGNCFIDSRSMQATFESLDYIKSGKISIFDYTSLYQIINKEFFTLIKDRKKINIDKIFEEANEYEVNDVHSLIKELNLYNKDASKEEDTMEKKLIKIFIVYKYKKYICFNKNNSPLFNILSEICYGYETNYRNLLIELLINNGKNLNFKNEFTDMSYFLLFKLLSLQTNETQIDIMNLLGGEYSTEMGFLQQFSQNLFNRIVFLFIDYLNPPDKIIQSNYFIAFNLIKIFKYLCEGHNNFFQKHLIKSLSYSYVNKIPSFYGRKVDGNKINDNDIYLPKEEEIVFDKYFEGNNNTNKDFFSIIKFFDFLLFVSTKLILISDWAKKSFKDENNQNPFFYDLFLSILELLIQIIQGNNAEILSSLCENKDEEIRDNSVDDFILPEFNKKLGLNPTHSNKQFNEKKNDAFETFVRESIVLIFKEKNNLELMYKVRNDVMEFFNSLIEEKNVKDVMKKIIYKHLNTNKIFSNISDILKFYYLNKNIDVKKINSKNKDFLHKKQETTFIYKKRKINGEKPVLKLKKVNRDNSTIPLVSTTSILHPIKRPDINEIIKMYNKIYMRKYSNNQSTKKMLELKKKYLNTNYNNKNSLLNNRNAFANSNCSINGNSSRNNLNANNEGQNDIPKNSINSQILESEAFSELNHQYNEVNINRISQIMKRHKSYIRNFKTIGTSRNNTINIMEKISKITLGKKLYNYFKIEFYDNELFNKTIEFKLANTFFKYIKLMDVHQKSLHNNSFLEDIIKINEEILNVDESQINPSEFEGDYGTFELTSHATLKNKNFPIEKTVDKDLIEKYYIVKFFESITTIVEIRTNEGKYQTVIFTKLPEMKYLTEGTKFEFVKIVNRDNETSKKVDLLRNIEYFIKEIEFNKKHHKNFEWNFLNKIDYFYLEVLVYLYALIFNLFILFTAKGDNSISDAGSEKDRKQSRKNIQNMIEMSINHWYKTYESLSYIYILLSIILIFLWLRLKLPLYYEIDKLKYKEQFKISTYKKLSLCNKLYIIIKMSIIDRGSFLLLIYVLIIGLCSLFISNDEMIFAFLLLPIMSINNTLKSLLISIQLRYKELILTFILAIIIMYIFSNFFFFFFNSDFDAEIDYFQDNYSKTLAFTFLISFDHGLGGPGDYATMISFLRKKKRCFIRAILDDLYFLLICIFMIDIVFGIIIQSFFELRDKVQKYKSDESNRCFICHINRIALEKNRSNFNEHIKTVHNLWNYVEYIIRLKFGKKQELNAVNNYAKTKIENKDISWLPTYKDLDKQNEDEDIECNCERNKLVVPEENIIPYKLRATNLNELNNYNKLLFIEGCYY